MLLLELGKLVEPERLFKWLYEILSEIKIKSQIWLSLEAVQGALLETCARDKQQISEVL
jgi:hypothetical protein